MPDREPDISMRIDVWIDNFTGNINEMHTSLNPVFGPSFQHYFLRTVAAVIADAIEYEEEEDSSSTIEESSLLDFFHPN